MKSKCEKVKHFNFNDEKSPHMWTQGAKRLKIYKRTQKFVKYGCVEKIDCCIIFFFFSPNITPKG